MIDNGLLILFFAVSFGLGAFTGYQKDKPWTPKINKRAVFDGSVVLDIKEDYLEIRFLNAQERLTQILNLSRKEIEK